MGGYGSGWQGSSAPTVESLRKRKLDLAELDKVRNHGPWQINRRGEIEKLKPEYRLALARDGYALVRSELAVFKPEA